MRLSFFKRTILPGILALAVQASEQKKFNKTIGHLQLETERRFGASEGDFLSLDKIINEASKSISKININSHQEAIESLQKINGLLKNEGFKADKGGVDFLFKALRDKKADCDIFTSIYLSISQKNDIPLTAVDVPAHFFIRWKLGKSYINWETTQGAVFRDEDYENYFRKRLGAYGLGRHPPAFSLEFKEYSPDAFAYWIIISRNNLGRRAYKKETYNELKKRNFTALAEYLSAGISSEPLSLERVFLRGAAYESIGLASEAMQDYNFASSFGSKIIEDYMDYFGYLTKEVKLARSAGIKERKGL